MIVYFVQYTLIGDDSNELHQQKFEQFCDFSNWIDRHKNCTATVVKVWYQPLELQKA